MKTALCLAAVGLVFTTACSSVQQTQSDSGPMRMSDASIKAGERLYNEHCYKCHDMGTGGLGFALNDKPLPRFAMHMQIRHGLGTMPAFSEKELSDQQVEQILDYIIALRHRDRK